MELDYNQPKTECPRYDCKNKDNCKCLSYFEIPAVLGDDSEGSDVAPKNGAYCNAIVKYAANGNIYLYSSEGIPTRVEQDFEPIINKMREDLEEETIAREAADAAIEQEIEDLRNEPDVVDIVGTYADLLAYDTSHLGDKDVIRVLVDETHDDESTYYRWNKTPQTWTYIGAIDGYYNKDQTDALLDEKQDTLTAGANVQINNNVISATDTTYTAGTGLNLNGTEFSVDLTTIAEKSDLPTTAAEVHALPDTTKYGATLTLAIDSSTYVVTATLKDQDGNTLGTAQTIDLPLESVVVSGAYDSQTKEVVLTLQSGSTIRFSVADLVSGLQETLIAGTNIQIASDGKTISATDTTYSDFTGTEGQTAGTSGLVPAPAITDDGKYLKADGTWGAIATSSGAKVLTSADNNWNSTAHDSTTEPFDAIALWLLPNGVYIDDYKHYDSSLKIYRSDGNSAQSNNDSSIYLVTDSGTSSSPNKTVTQVNRDDIKQYRPARQFSNFQMLTTFAKKNDIYYTNNSNTSDWARPQIGAQSKASGQSAIAIGTSASATAQGSVAIGAYSSSSTVGVMNIGTSNTGYGYSTSNYRLLTGLYDPQSAHDAATKGYVDGRVLTNSGAPTTSTVGTVGQILEDTTNGKLYICTDATNPYVWEEVGSGGGGGLVTLSYGNSTWNDFITAYNAGEIVYCRASSGSDPSVGSQTRMAFMAYVNNATNPTEVEFQYVRSVSTKSASNQSDMVFVYKLTNAGTWTVETRPVMVKIAAGTNAESSYASNTLTINPRLYTTTGQNTDGGVTQKLFTDTVGNIESALNLINNGGGN